MQSPNLKSFSFHALKTATKSFRYENMLGEGGFGIVFRGKIYEQPHTVANPRIVAVKILNREGLQGHREWLAEVNYLGQLHHPNLVRLIGYCLEDDKRLLVYEFMSRGSLENHLFNRNYKPLSWTLRLKAALGAAKGLAYLHSPEANVIYRDFKCSNILLDSDYNAKLSDFGLAKDGPVEGKSHVSTRVMGTYGYAAPEYMASGHLSERSDIYSFGVVLLEILTGRPCIDKTRPSNEQMLVDFAKPYLTSRRMVLQIMDRRIHGQYSSDVAMRVAALAKKCLVIKPKYRPTADELVKVLTQLQLPELKKGSYIRRK